MRELFYFSVAIIFLYFIYSYEIYESFNVPFATPPDTSDSDKDSMKNLLEIGSQANEDKKYDVVSKKILGKINRVAPNEEVIEPEDPICFNEPSNYSYSDGLRNDPNKTTVCCDRPNQKEIDMDWNFLQESLDLDYGLGLDGIGEEIPYCCNRN